jgi:hypothetical protein
MSNSRVRNASVLGESLNLQLSRNLEQFLDLLNLSVKPLELPLEFQEGSFRLYLEIQQERLLLTSSYEAGEGRALRLLFRLLQYWMPEHCQGVVQRTFILDESVLISCAPPEASQAALWYQLYCLQRQLLEQALRVVE